MDTADKAPAPPSARLSGAALNWTILLVLVVIWGSTYAGIRIGVETIDPAWLVTGRLLSGSFFLGVWLIARRVFGFRPEGYEPVSRKAVLWFGLIGLSATALPFVLYATSAKTTGSAVLAICNGATPFATVLLAHLLTSDKLTQQRIVGVLLGFAGLVVLVLPELGEEGGGNFWGIALAVIGAWLYAIGNVGTKMAPRVEAGLSSFLIVFMAGLGALAFALIDAPFPTNASPKSIIAMLLLGLLPTALAMFFYVWLIQRAGSVFVSFTTYLQPLWAAGVGVVFLGEDLRWSMAGALALILLGVGIASVRRMKPV
ncbi:MAG TPA: DMT family transporter [Hyphomonadaceae bacterium]|nr:DMT family transporter [Hyphomonadaceae bacterium]